MVQIHVAPLITAIYYITLWALSFNHGVQERHLQACYLWQTRKGRDGTSPSTVTTDCLGFFLRVPYSSSFPLKNYGCNNVYRVYNLSH